jgi:hypothetical protein
MLEAAIIADEPFDELDGFCAGQKVEAQKRGADISKRL